MLKLNYSYKELKAIGTLFPNSQLNFQSGSKSTKKHFLTNYINQDIIHFSVHAQSSNQEKLDNKIFFNQQQHNILYGFEIDGLAIDASLVVLSSCRSAFGRTVIGEGTFSLTRSFIQAGAESVVATRWDADEFATYDLMTKFYQRIAEGHQPADALHAAKLQYLDEKDSFQTHPKLWGNLVCYTR